MPSVDPPPHDLSRNGAGAADDEVTCRQFIELITDYFEDELEPRTLDRVEEHLVMCDWCVTYLEQMKTTIAALGELRTQPEPSEAAPEALAAVAARRKGGG